MKSPIYDTEMKAAPYHGIEVESCPISGGVFLRKGELDKITPPHEGDLEYSTLEQIDPTRKSDLRCPACHTQMDSVRFATFSSIPMDYCEGCGGLWVEKKALQSIQEEVLKLERKPETWSHGLMVFISKLPF